MYGNILYSASILANVSGSVPEAVSPPVPVVAAILALRRVAAVTFDIGLGAVGPGSVGISNATPILASMYSVVLNTRDRCPNSVWLEGMDMAFCSNASRNALILVKVGASVAVDKRGIFSGETGKFVVISLVDVIFGSSFVLCGRGVMCGLMRMYSYCSNFH